MKRFQSHHVAWLAAHPHRSSHWLRERLRDGFDVHHLDGNHQNDDPSNLVLIEHTDHMLMHIDRRTRGRLGKMFPQLGIEPKPKKAKRPRTTVYANEPRAKLAYDMRCGGEGWFKIGLATGFGRSLAATRARAHARANDLPWPPPTISDRPNREAMRLRHGLRNVAPAFGDTT